MNITNNFLLSLRKASVALFALALVFSIGVEKAHAIDASNLMLGDVSITYGDDAGLTVNLENGGGSDVGGADIGFFLDGNFVATSTTDSNGAATITIQDLDAGTYSISAFFYGGVVNAIEYFPSSDTATLDVEEVLLTVSGLTAEDKVYDGNDTAQITGSGTLNGVLSGDDVSLSGSPTGEFDDKDVDTNKDVVVSGLSLIGLDAGNYDIDPLSLELSADVTVLGVSVEITAEDRDYDATTDATATYEVVGDVGSDDVEATGTATFDTKDIGTGKLVTATGITLDGSDKDNYTLLNTSATTTADIDPKALSAAVTVLDKDYDDTTTATINTITAVGLEGGEVVTITGGVAVFENQHAGVRDVEITGLLLTPDAVSANYDFTDTAATTATINPLALTVTAVSDSKVYDSTTASAGAPIVSGTWVGNDTPDFLQTFDTANVGTGKTLTPSGAMDDDNGGANYSVAFVEDFTGEITKAPLTITADDLEKVYGSANPSPTATYTGFEGSDNEGDLDVGVTLVVVANALSDVGNHVITAFGASDANYVITHENGNLEVTPFTLVADASASDKVYDGSTSATASVSPTGMLFGDTVTATHTSAEFDTANVGAGKEVTLFGVSLAGVDAGNYTIDDTATAYASITERSIEVSADEGTKVYGASDPTLTYSITSGSLADGDSFSGELDRESGEDVGVYAIDQGTLDAGTNYTLSFTGNNFSITPAPLTVTANDETKVYLDPLPSFSATYTGFVNGDDEGDLDSTPSFATTADESSSTGDYPITPSGASGSNYTITHVEGTLTIIAADQTIEFDPLPDMEFGDSNFSVSATSTSGLPVYFTAAGSCTIDVVEVHLTTKGTCTITAHQEGDSNWNPADDVEQSFEVEDVVAPVITLVGNSSIEVVHNPGGVYVDPGASAADDVDGSVAVVVSGFVDIETQGVYILQFDATDDAGNAATTLERTVTVVAPVSVGGGGGGSRRSTSQPQGEVLGASDYQFTRHMGVGTTGEDVSELQKLLTTLGYYQGPITGYYGPLTMAAVRAFQAANSIPQTGYVGPLTLAALNGAEAGSSNAAIIADIEAKLKALQEELAKMLAN